MVLAIDTASKTATVAIVEKNEVIAEFSVLSEKTHSKAVLPMIESLFDCSGKEISDIEYIACCEGPGSFTGLRIGAAVAKAVAFSLDKKIVPVSSLDVLAYNVLITGSTVCPMIDARGGHVYTAFYSYDGGVLSRLSDYATLSVADAVVAGMEYGAPMFFLGSGAESYKEKLLAAGGVVAPPRLNMHRAGVLGAYAYDYYERLSAVEGAGFSPVYMSRSQAEADNG